MEDFSDATRFGSKRVLHENVLKGEMPIPMGIGLTGVFRELDNKD
ncbi:hypothetical protein TTRE_0000637801 [Trichuris trichiura]|uniref:Uncharacterized protein n=1 Tax=Trichuris trichiura TaxID=36087 RepID=A0A077ZCH6_TRITR|nr:hypothetical protein TTRE_0000637801 [Trichuris trichiura]